MNKNYKDGIDYAVQQMYSGNNEFNKMTNEIRMQQGDEACSQFMNGYYKALAYFTNAINHYKDSPKYIEEQVNNIEQSHGEEIKKVFLMGLEYYKKLDDEMNSNKIKK